MTPIRDITNGLEFMASFQQMWIIQIIITILNIPTTLMLMLEVQSPKNTICFEKCNLYLEICSSNPYHYVRQYQFDISCRPLMIYLSMLKILVLLKQTQGRNNRYLNLPMLSDSLLYETHIVYYEIFKHSCAQWQFYYLLHLVQ